MHLTDLWYRIRGLVFRRSFEVELTEEFTHHRALETERLIREGMSPEAAATEAQRRFGNDAAERQRTRDAWGLRGMWDFLGDVRIALRQLWRRPAFSVLAVSTLALGIGATVAFASVVRGLLLRPLPIVDEDQVYVFWMDFDWRGVEFDYVRDGLSPQGFAQLAAYSSDGYMLDAGQGEGTEVMLGGEVSAEMFDLLGTPALHGRTFRAGEDRPGAELAVVLSYGLWRQAFGGDPAAVGRVITVSGRQTRIIGVMPAGFFFPTPNYRLWVTLNLDPSTRAYQGNGYLTLVGRTTPGLTSAQLNTEVSRIAARLGERFTYPARWDKTKNSYVTSLREYTMGDVRPAVLLLLGAVGLLLLMATANVAALVMARTADRSAEISVRVAMGARGGRLVRQILAESLTLALVAASFGALLARVFFGVLVSRLPLANGLNDALSMDWSMVLVAGGLAALIGVLVAAAPVRNLLGGRLRGVSGTRSAAGGARTGLSRAHGTLVATEVGLAVILMVGALLFVRSVSGLYAIDPGFETAGVVTADLFTPETGMDSDQRRAFFHTVLEEVAALPGVEAVGIIQNVPLRDPGWQGSAEMEDRLDLRGTNAPNAVYRIVSPSYFEAMGIRLLEGRRFDSRDRADGARVTMVSQGFAERIWPDGSALGRRIRTRAGDDGSWMTVVGVVEEARVFSMTGENPMLLYVPQEQAQSPTKNVLVTRWAEDSDPVEAIGALRRRLRPIDPRVAITRVVPMRDIVADAIAEPIRLRFFLTVFGGLALTLGGVGIYGVVAYAVARQRAEIGVRLALGAAPVRVLREIVRTSMRPVAVGVLVGMGVSYLLGRVVAGMLYGVAPTDRVSFAVAALLLAGAGLLASVIPGWRAGRISPLEAIRAD